MTIAWGSLCIIDNEAVLSIFPLGYVGDIYYELALALCSLVGLDFGMVFFFPMFSKTGNQSKNDKDIQERLRVLQNQNKFLNEEVRKLAKLRETDRTSFYQQEE